VAQLLHHLQPLQQLTHLSMSGSLQAVEGSTPPASACAALTASSKLQHLDICRCILPADVWQHVFPAGRQLPNLQSLNISGIKQPSGSYAQTPEATRLVSCCPCLHSLRLGSRPCSAELLASLQGLSGLQVLQCGWGEGTAEGVQAVCQLTGLRELVVCGLECRQEEGSLLQLSLLQQLTMLQYRSQRYKGFNSYGVYYETDLINLSGGLGCFALLVHHVFVFLLVRPTTLGSLGLPHCFGRVSDRVATSNPLTPCVLWFCQPLSKCQ
jgi:hypothetical protein